jgi:uncharacterized repeat protein (TIGR03837 family)
MKITPSSTEFFTTEAKAARTKSGAQQTSCDIFCNVIDNYGDIGVSWRLARQLANEFGLDVRLFVDDLASFARLCPEADAALDMQRCRGVEVRLWTADAFPPLSQPPLPDGERGVADLVIEAFACKLPESYLAAMAASENKSVWINLEYLSAEDWVEGCHKLPSPRPPLTRYFFFPGFTRKTGGLLLEHDLLARRDAFLKDPVQQQVFWQSIGMAVPAPDTLKISLFAYENAALTGLFDVWAGSERAVLCLVPEGRILPQVVQYFGDCVGMNPDLQRYCRGNLQVRVLPFVEQERYDELLWACDMNFVRGEDSCVRAQWAGKPFVWQIYPQHDEVHWQKLQAFLNLYDAKLTPQAAMAMQGLWRIWNGGDGQVAEAASTGSGQAASTQPSALSVAEGSGQAWGEFAAARPELDVRAKVWTRELSQNNLALNLLAFFQEIGTMRAFKIDGQ